MRLPRRSTLPQAVRAALPLERRERVLAHAATVDGGHVVATDRALLVPDGASWCRVPWHTVARAGWDDDAEALTVAEVGEPGAAPARHVLVLPSPEELPTTVRERVTASIVVSRHVRLAGRAGVRVVARRVPGEAEPVWQLVPDRGVDLGDPDVRARAQAALTELRRQTLP